MAWFPAAGHCTCQRWQSHSPLAPQHHSCMRQRSVGCHSPTVESGPQTPWRGSGKGQRCQSGGFHNACTLKINRRTFTMPSWNSNYHLTSADNCLGGKLPAIQGNDMWVCQRVADGSRNVLDRDLGTEVRRTKIRGAPPCDLLTLGFDVFTKHRWENSSATGPSETQCLEGWHHVLHNVIACVDATNDYIEQCSLNIMSNHQTGTLLALNPHPPLQFYKALYNCVYM